VATGGRGTDKSQKEKEKLEGRQRKKDRERGRETMLCLASESHLIGVLGKRHKKINRGTKDQERGKRSTLSHWGGRPGQGEKKLLRGPEISRRSTGNPM